MFTPPIQYVPPHQTAIAVDWRDYLRKLFLLITEPGEFLIAAGSAELGGRGLEFFFFSSMLGAVVATSFFFARLSFRPAGAGEFALFWRLPAEAALHALMIGAAISMVLGLIYHVLTNLLGGKSTLAQASRLSFHIVGLASLVYQPAILLEDCGGGYLIAAGGAFLCYLLGRAAEEFGELKAGPAWALILLLMAAHTHLAFRYGALDLKDFEGVTHTASPKPRAGAFAALTDAQKRWLADSRERALSHLNQKNYAAALADSERSLAFFPAGYKDVAEIKQRAQRALASVHSARSSRPRR